MRAVFISPAQRNQGFEPIMWLRSQEMIQTLRQMGVEVLPFLVDPETEARQSISRAVQEFRPDFITAVNFNYFLDVTLQEDKVLDFLDRPIIALWDDPLGALARYLKQITEKAEKGCPNARSSKFHQALQMPLRILKQQLRFLSEGPDVLQTFRSIIGHPLIKHFCWDSGHIEAVTSLGLIERAKVRWFPIVTYRPFLEMGTKKAPVPKKAEVSFCGNIYLDFVRQSVFWQDEFLRSVSQGICDRKMKGLDRSVWDIMVEQVEKLSPAGRKKYGLYYEKKSFWDYYIFTVWYAVNTFVRLGILSGLRRSVNVYGLFADPKSRDQIAEYPNLSFQGSFDHFGELPAIYASSKINVCISNGLNYQGIPSKLVDCLASGGFALTDPKEDLVKLFGEPVKSIFYRDGRELNEKIEYFLARPAERDQIVSELQKQIQNRCTLPSLFEKVLASI